MIMGLLSSMVCGQEHHQNSEPMDKIKCAECMKEMQDGEKSFDASSWMFDGAEVCARCKMYLDEQERIQKLDVQPAPSLKVLFSSMTKVFIR